MSGLTIPTPFTSHGLVYISSGYPGGGLRPVYAVRPGASGDISIFTEEQMRSGIAPASPVPLTSSEENRVVVPAARHLQHDGDRLRRHLLHAARPRVPGRPRRPDRGGDLRPAAPGDRQRLHRVALGLQRKAVPAERGRGDVRGGGGAGVQDPSQEPARRDDAGDPGDRARQPLHPHAGRSSTASRREAGSDDGQAWRGVRGGRPSTGSGVVRGRGTARCVRPGAGVRGRGRDLALDRGGGDPRARRAGPRPAATGPTSRADTCSPSTTCRIRRAPSLSGRTPSRRRSGASA